MVLLLLLLLHMLVLQVGTWYRQWELEYSEEACELYVPGTSTYIYANTQQPSTAWFHDHT